jgi:PAS domain S-box-containing protein
MPQNQSTKQRCPAIFDLDEQEQNQLFRTIIRRSLSGLFIFQGDRVVLANPALQDIVGLTEDEILRMNPFDLVHPADRDLVRQRAAQRLKGGAPPDDYEFRILEADGKARWVRLLATSVTYRERPAVLANILDINEQKRAQELQQEADRLRTTLLDSLPHRPYSSGAIASFWRSTVTPKTWALASANSAAASSAGGHLGPKLQ